MLHHLAATTAAILPAAALAAAALAVPATASTGPLDLPATPRAATSHTLVFQPDQDTLSSMRLPSGKQATLQSSRSSVREVALSPDGRRVAWTSYTSDGRIPSDHLRVRTTSARGKAANVLARHPRRFEHLDDVAWSPNGRRLVFTAWARNRAATFDAWIIKRNGRHLTKIASRVGSCPDGCGQLLWAPDGKSIAWYTEGDDGRFSEGWHRLRLASGRTTRLPDGFFGWSDSMRWVGILPPDSSRIVVKRTNGSHRRELKGPYPDTYGAAPEMFFGAGKWIGYRTDEVTDTGENDDQYVAINFGTTRVTTLHPADPERGGPFAFR
ncbi:MAG: hypothetical protein WBP61_07365 [Nocardioides sp.]